MKRRAPYYCIAALFVIAGHLEAQSFGWDRLAAAAVVVLLTGVALIAVVEFCVFERERMLRGLDGADEQSDTVVPETPEETTVVIPACRDAEPHPLFVGVRSGFEEAEGHLSTQADDASATVLAIHDEVARELGVT